MKTLTELLIAETTEFEFKEELEIKKSKSWLKTVSAFANGVGGSIYFGISDDGAIVGLVDVQKVAEQISEFIKTKIEPTINFILEPLTVENKEILRLEIKTGHNTPYYYSSDGNKIAFVRLGNESVQTPVYILNELILKGQHLSYDALESKNNLKDFSFTLLEATYKQITGNPLELPNDFISFGLMLENQKLTYAGALLADQCPIVQSRIFCTRWNGLEKGSIFDDALDDSEFNGNIISLLNNALGFVKNNSKVKWRKTPTGREEMPDYPQIAVREALVNAIIHRDYMVLGSEIHVDMYDDRLEIVSPGGMYDGRKIQELDIKEIASIRRNPIISDMFHRLRFMERRGSGLKKIAKEYQDENPPAFYSTDQIFKTTLKNLNYGKTSSPNGGDVGGDDVVENNAKLILTVISAEPKITQKNLAVKTGLSERTVSREIKSLRESGVIRRVGSDRAGYWEIILVL